MNLAEIVTQIKLDYPESEIGRLLEKKLEATTPESTWKELGYKNAGEWYRDYGNGDQDDEVIWDLITYWEQKYNKGKELPESVSCEIHDRLIEEYTVLY